MSEIPLSQPDITQVEIDAVVNAMQSNRLSIGPRQDLFEELVAQAAGRRYAVAVSSGTAGLHCVLLGLGIGPGDEVITTPFSFIASANVILMVGATPKFVDICPTSLNLDPAKVEEAITDKTKAILGVEVFGNPRHIDRLEAIARKHEIPFIEDCCEGLGGSLVTPNGQQRKIGSFGAAGVFGFYPNKQITTGEGGMIVTDDERLANLCKSLRNQGRAVAGSGEDPTDKKKFQATSTGAWLAHERLGYNYRLSEINCALGCAQMDRLDEMITARRNVASMYMQQLMDWDDLLLPNPPAGCEEFMSWFVFVVRLNDTYGSNERDRIITGLRRHEIGSSNYFPCIHLQPFYRQQFGFKEGDFPIAESISERTIALPFYTTLDQPHIDLVCHTLKIMIQREQLLRRDD